MHACRMEKMYTAVLTAQKAAIAALQPGKPLSAAHGAAVVSLTSSGASPHIALHIDIVLYYP